MDSDCAGMILLRVIHEGDARTPTLWTDPTDCLHMKD